MTDKPIIKHRDNINEIIAGDKCFLREIFHPERDNVSTDHSLAHAYIKPGGRTINHYLKNQSETYYIISGNGIMHLDDQEFRVDSGNSYYCPKGCSQWLVNEGEDKLEFLVIVDPPWKEEDEFIVEK